MSIFRDYIRLHLRIAFRVYQFIFLLTDKRLFAALFNLQSLLIFSPARCTWDGNSFIVTDKSLPSKKSRIRARLQCIGAYKFGFERRAQDLEECYFLDRIDFKDGDRFIDCGANVGDLKMRFDLRGINVEYIGFEPSPVEYECLRQNVAPSKVHNIGLWNEAGERNLYVSSQEADSSLIEPPEYDEVLTLKVGKLADNVSGRIKCLKLEAEGAEPEVLQGLGSKLKLVDYVTADLGHERGIMKESTLTPVTNNLLSQGFELVEVTHSPRLCALYRNSRINRA